MATVTSLGFSIFSRFDGSGVTRANHAINRLQRNMNNASTGINTFSGRMATMVTIAVSAGPALIPIAGAAAAAGAGLLAAATAAGAAGGLFGFALKGAAQMAGEMDQRIQGAADRVAKARTALQNATPGTKAYTKAQHELNEALKAQQAITKNTPKIFKQYTDSVESMRIKWHNFVKDMAPTTLTPTITVIDAITGSIDRLRPVVQAVGPVAQEVADAFANWTKDGGLQRFIDLVIKFGVPALRSFKNIAIDLLTVLGEGFRAFLPLGIQVVQWLERGANSLAKWAQGGGFQRFLQWVVENGPQLREFFNQLGILMGHLAQVFLQIAPTSLQLATALLRIVNAIPIPVLTAIVQLFILWKTAMMGMMVVNAIARGFALLATVARAAGWAFWFLDAAMAANPVGAVIIGILALVAAIVLIATKTHWFQNIWHAMGLVFGKVVNFMRSKWGLLVLALGPIGWLMLLAANWDRVWRGIKGVASGVWNWLKKHWKLVIGVLTGPIGLIALNWSAVWRTVKGVAKRIWGWITGAWRAFTGIFKSGPFEAFGKAWGKVWGGVKSAVKGAWKFISGIFDKIKDGVKKVIKSIGGIADKIPGVKGAKSILKHIPLIGGLFASGGPVSGPGNSTSDSIVARLSTGEHVWTAREVVAAGGHRAVMALRHAVLGRHKGPSIPRFASGGPVAGGGGGTPSAGAAASAAGATNAAIQRALQPVVRLFKATIPAAAGQMQSSVTSKWSAMRASTAASVTGIVDAASHLITSWHGASDESARLAVNSATGTARIKGSWNQLKSGVSASANAMKAAAFAPVLAAQQTLIPGSANNMQNQVRAKWSQALHGILGSHSAMEGSAFKPMRTAQQNQIPASANSMQNQVRAKWSQMLHGAQGSHRALNSSVYQPTKNMYTRQVPGWANSMKNGVTKSFVQMKDGVRKAWDGLKGATRDPVNWVIGNTYSKGIRTLWNAVSNVIFGNGKKNLPAVHKFAKGGRVDGPGTATSDSIPAMLSKNEHIWTAKEVSKAGGHHAVAALRSRIMGGQPVRVNGGQRLAEGGAPTTGNMAKDLVRGQLTPWIGPRMDKFQGAMHRHLLGEKIPFQAMVGQAMDQKIADILNFVEQDDAANSFIGGGFVPWRAWKAGDERHVNWHGVTINARSREMVENAQKLFKKNVSAFQGSWSHAAASAGTHSGGGAIDVGPAVDPLVGAMRASGWAAWRRTPKEGFSPHIHGIAVGDPTVAPGAAAQVRAFFAGRNGLANNGPDTFLGAGGGGNAIFTSFWDSFALMASGKRMNGKSIASSYIPLGSRIRVKIGGKQEDGVIEDLGPAKFVYDRHKGKAVFDLNELMMARMTGRRVNTATGNWSLLSVGSGRTLYGKRLRGFSEGGGVPFGSYDKGGYLPQGLSLAYNGTGKPERVGGTDGGVHVHIHGNVYAKSSMEFEDMLTGAMAELKRKGRLPK